MTPAHVRPPSARSARHVHSHFGEDDRESWRGAGNMEQKEKRGGSEKLEREGEGWVGGRMEERGEGEEMREGGRGEGGEREEGVGEV